MDLANSQTFTELGIVEENEGDQVQLQAGGGTGELVVGLGEDNLKRLTFYRGEHIAESLQGILLDGFVGDGGDSSLFLRANEVGLDGIEGIGESGAGFHRLILAYASEAEGDQDAGSVGAVAADAEHGLDDGPELLVGLAGQIFAVEELFLRHGLLREIMEDLREGGPLSRVSEGKL